MAICLWINAATLTAARVTATFCQAASYINVQRCVSVHACVIHYSHSHTRVCAHELLFRACIMRACADPKHNSRIRYARVTMRRSDCQAPIYAVL